MRIPLQQLSLSLLILLVPLVSAIFADEAYETDYQHLLLGAPQEDSTFFHRPSATSKASLLYTLSERLILGAVNPKDGAIIWRQWLTDSHQVGSDKGHLKALDGEDVVISAIGNRVQAWDAADGRMVWEWLGEGPVRSLEVLDIHRMKGDVLALTEGFGKSYVTRLAASSGEVVWKYTDESGDLPVAVSTSSSNIYYLALHSALLSGYRTKFTTLDILTGKMAIQATLNTESEITSKDSILYIGSRAAAPLLIWTDAKFKTLKMNVFGSKQVTTVIVANKDDAKIESVRVHAPRSATAQTHFLIHYETSTSHWAEVYHVDISKGSVTRAFEIPSVDGRGAFSSSTLNAIVYFIRTADSEVTLVSSAAQGILGRWPIRLNNHGDLAALAGIAHAVSEVVSKDGLNFAVRSALTLPSGDWALIRNGDPVWIRPESLAGVVAAAFADIPVEADLARELAVESHDNVLVAYIHRVRRHVRDLKQFPNWVQQIPGRVLSSFVGEKSGSQNQPLQKDGFGFRKIVILATEKGRVVALDAEMQGRFLWNFQAADVAVGSAWNVTSINIENDRAVLLVLDGESICIDTVTGKPKPLNLGVSQDGAASHLSLPSPYDPNYLITVQADGTPAKVAPGALGGASTLLTRSPSGSVKGWKFSDTLEPVLTWEFFPALGEEILSLVKRPAHDPVASVGKALGDRNVLYKYLSSNLLLITAASAAASTASIYLLDTITGQTLYTTTHTGVDTSKPIPATFTENWFAYSIFSDHSIPSLLNTSSSLPKAYQLIITELYESPLRNDRGPLGAAINFSSLAALPVPHAISAAYVIPAPISHLTTASTLQGITPRALLATLPSLAALISIPLPYLSPRRPVGREPTSAEQEEGLFRYHPVLDFNPHWIITHKREVLGIKGVATTPTLMESTSAVVAWGDVDVFGTRVSPIGAFDALGRGFSRVQLVGTVVALGLGTAVLGPMVRRKQINGMWTS